MHDVNTFFIQKVKYLGIVDQGTMGENGAVVFAWRVQSQFNGPSHPHAKAGSFGNDYFHKRSLRR
jgi:hypothetical protein